MAPSNVAASVWPGTHMRSFRGKEGAQRPELTKGSATPGSMLLKTLVLVEAGPRRGQRKGQARVGAMTGTTTGGRPRSRRQKLTAAADATPQPPFYKEPMLRPAAADATPQPQGQSRRQTARGNLPIRIKSRVRTRARRGTSTRRGPGERHAAQGTDRGEEAFRNQADPLTEPDTGGGLRRGPRDGDPRDEDRRRKGHYGRTARVDLISGEGGGRRSACNEPASLPSHTMPRLRSLGRSIEAPKCALPDRIEKTTGENTSRHAARLARPTHQSVSPH